MFSHSLATNLMIYVTKIVVYTWSLNSCPFSLILLERTVYTYYYVAIKAAFWTQRFEKKSFLSCATHTNTHTQKNAMAHIHPWGFKSQWPVQQPQSSTLFPNAACSLNPFALDHRSEPPPKRQNKVEGWEKEEWNNGVTDTFSQRDPVVSTSTALTLLRSQFCSRTSRAIGKRKKK